MENDANPLEVKQFGKVMESSTTFVPVVLVQYRNRGVPLWVLIPLVVVVPLSAILIYHRLVVVRYRAQAIRARQALESRIDGGQTVVTPTVERKLPEPLALNSQPIKAETSPSAPVPVPLVKTTESVPAPSSTAPSIEADSQPPAKATPATLPAHSIANGAESTPETFSLGNAGILSHDSPIAESEPTANAGMESVGGKATSARPQSILGSPIITLGQPGHTAIPAKGIQPIVASEKSSIGARTEVEDSRGASTRAPGPRVSEPMSQVEGQNASDDPFDVKAEALPTREESLQQIKDEAAKKQAEIEGRDQNRETEFRAMRRGERVKFRDSLREALRTFGNNAGPEIDRLAKQYGYDQDRDKFVQARYAWKFARMSTESRVRLTRELDLPETTILNLLSEDIDKQIGSRGGPRDRNEVRIRAAKLLLNFPLPATDAPSKPRQSGRPGPGVAAGEVSPRTSSPRSAVVRSQ